MKEFYVAMTIEGAVVPSSAVFNGTEKQCAACANRLMRREGRHKDIAWIVLPCIQ